MTIRKLSIASLVVLSLLASAATSFAGNQTFSGHVIAVRVSNVNGPAISVTLDGDGSGGVTNPSCTGTWWGARFAFTASSPIYKEMLAETMAALLSGRLITGAVDTSCGGQGNTFVIIDLGVN